MSNLLTIHPEKFGLPAILQGKALQATILFVVALVFGGGGSGAGLLNLVVQLVALAIIALNPQATFDFFRHAPRHLALLVGAALLLPVFQSIPLPPSIWEVLPGRELVAESLALLGGHDTWFPMSLNVRRTMIAFLSLMPPLAILLLAWRFSEAEKRQLLLLIAAAGIFVVLLGTQQLATGNQHFVLFAETLGSKDLHGTFANHNSTGLFLGVTLCALIGAYPERTQGFAWPLGASAVAILLIVGLVLTRSRSSMALSVVPFVLFIFRIFQSRLSGKMSARAVMGIIGSIALLATGVAMLAHRNQQIQQSLTRFDDLQDARPLIWADSVQSIRRFWPVGSGIGTFDEVFQVDETLENLGPGRAARAHSDYLETALESGLLGIVLVGASILCILTTGASAVRRDIFASAPLAVFALLALQSILDYPMRSQTMLCTTGLMLALLIGSRSKSKEFRQAARRRDVAR